MGNGAYVRAKVGEEGKKNQVIVLNQFLHQPKFLKVFYHFRINFSRSIYLLLLILCGISVPPKPLFRGSR